MHWPHARIRRPRNVVIQERVAVARRDNPESEAWLGLLEAALGESEDGAMWEAAVPTAAERPIKARSEEHTSELQSLTNLVCRLLLEKKKIEQTTLRTR